MKQLFTILSLLIFNISLFGQISKNMTELAHWDPDTLPKAGGIHYNEVWGYTDCNANEYAIMGSAGFVHFFELNADNNLTEVGNFEGGNVTTWRDHKTYEDHSYSVCDGCAEGMMIFDLSNMPDSVVKVQQNRRVVRVLSQYLY